MKLNPEFFSYFQWDLICWMPFYDPHANYSSLYFTYLQRKHSSLSIPIKTLKYLGEIILFLECGITEIAIGHGWEAVNQNIAIYRS